MFNFNEFCKTKKCPNYIVYELQARACHTCDLYGFTFDITVYPETCIHLAEIKEVAIDAKTKDNMWKKLNKIKEEKKENDISKRVF